MGCEQTRPQLSAALDGDPDVDSAQLGAHLRACPDCADFAARSQELRTALRLEALTSPPDVAPAVVERLGARRSAPRRFSVQVAAAFLAAFLVGAAVVASVGGDPLPIAAADLSTLVVEAQDDLQSMTAAITIIERGAAAGERTLHGTLAYQAPESVGLLLRERSSEAELAFVVDGERAWTSGPCGRPCTEPAAPQALEGREPFSSVLPAPLDLVLPVDGFALDNVSRTLRREPVQGRSALGVRVPASQLEALLAGLRMAGRLRDVHPADVVDLWLDARTLVPLRLTVAAGEGEERRLWTARHGYTERPGAVYLEVELRDLAVNSAVPRAQFPPAPAEAEWQNAGFVPDKASAVDAPAPTWLPDGMAELRAGWVQTPKGPRVAVRTWSDGRAWLQLRATREWTGQRLFGDLGEAVRPTDLGDAGLGYTDPGGQRLALHAEGADVVLLGSVAAADLRRVAATLGLVGQAVPADWAEATAGTVAGARGALPGLLLPPDGRLEGFGTPAVRVADNVVTLTYVGPGSRMVVLTQAPGDRLSPPLGADVTAVEVRGRTGRRTPSRQELEWAEEGLVISLRSASVGGDELLAIAGELTPA